MRILAGQRGSTLLEMITALAISGMIAAPLAALFSSQLRLPAKVVSELKSAQQTQKSTQVISRDTMSARSFAPGQAPVYGTFSWIELTGDEPIPVTARYLWDQEQKELLRLLTRGGVANPANKVISGIREYGDVSFQNTPPNWSYDQASKNWSYTEGKIEVNITQTLESGAGFESTISTERLVADFRPQTELPAPLPSPAPALQLIEGLY